MNELLFSIPNLAILYWIVSLVVKHRERMALIERNMDPNLAEEERQSRTRPSRTLHFWSPKRYNTSSHPLR